MSIDFNSLVGHEFGFCGVDNYTFKLDGNVFEAVEDPDDGYRSMLDEVIERTDIDGLIFFGQPVAAVKVEEDPDIDGYRLVDVADNHVWLRLGTDCSVDYYPSFVFEYTAKIPTEAP